MSRDPIRQRVIDYWTEKAHEALAAARDDLRAGRYAFAVNRAYYACFYALSAALLNDNEKFAKHSGVRGGLHRLYVKTGRIDEDMGRFYDRLFDNRQRADYQELIVFEQAQAEELLDGAERFVVAILRLLD